MLGLALLRRFFRCRKGVSAIEFGLIAPIIFVAITGVIDFMLVMFVTALMEGGLRDGSRLGRTGFEPAEGTREEAIRQRIANATIGLLDMNDVVIKHLVYPSFQSIGQPEPFTDTNANTQYDPEVPEPFTDVNGNGQWDDDMGTAGLGNSGDIVLYTVQYDWQLLTPILPTFLPGGGTIALKASLAIRNEPW